MDGKRWRFCTKHYHLACVQAQTSPLPVVNAPEVYDEPCAYIFSSFYLHTHVFHGIDQWSWADLRSIHRMCLHLSDNDFQCVHPEEAGDNLHPRYRSENALLGQIELMHSLLLSCVALYCQILAPLLSNRANNASTAWYSRERAGSLVCRIPATRSVIHTAVILAVYI